MPRTSLREVFNAMRGVFALRGAVCLVFALLALLWPQVTVTVVVLVFAACLIVDGVLNLWAAWRQAGGGRGMAGAQAMVAIVAGALMLAAPQQAAVYLALGVGLWIIAVGVLVAVVTVTLWRQLFFKAALALGSMLVVAMGLTVALYPAAAVSGTDGRLALMVGAVAAAGATLLMLSWSMRAPQEPQEIERPT